MNKTIICAIAVTALLSLATLNAEERQRPGPPDAEAVTMATEFGLQRSQIASFDHNHSDRLVRLGRVAQARGRYQEAKRFFWQAILVDPSSKLAWSHYDQAVLLMLVDNVENMPGLLGLPGLLDQEGQVPEREEPELEEGC
jgi:tetratricopeptide (TPR) repeat protein